MPVYNAGVFFESALNSILNQNYTHWELLIADDGCTDGCLTILKTLNDPRIKVISDGFNLGISKRLNKLIDIAQGEYIARMDSDDIAHHQRISEQVNFLKNNPHIDLVATRAHTINTSNEITGDLPYKISHDQICAKPWLGFYMAHPTWMGKAAWFKHYKYSEKTHFCEDQELLLRSHKYSQFATLNYFLLSYRVYPQVRLVKLLITRFSMLKFQLSYFLQRKDLISITLALLCFLFRTIKSLFRGR